jgi:threonine aldolase
MRAAMMAADVGDDVFGDDPTINALQERVAALLGKEAALFVPSGSMANQICVKVHTQPGDEIICESTCHIYTWEAGGPAALSGVMSRTVAGDCGILDVAQLRDKIRPANEHYARTRLVTLENTHNRGGGRVYPLPMIQAIAEWAHANDLAMHLDGARLWNAHVASGIALADWCAPFDSVAVCFSKGLGAPFGSAIAGTKEFIARARRVRKLLGGNLRQAGILAAAVLHALDHHVSRLAEDHRHAQIIADAIRRTPGLWLDPPFVETNLVWFDINPGLMTAAELGQRMREKGILLYVGDQTARACTHLDVSLEQAEYVAQSLRDVCTRR